MNAMLQVSFATAVFFVQEVLALDAAAFGVLMTGGAAGAVVGSFAASKVSERLGSGTALLITLGGSAEENTSIGDIVGRGFPPEDIVDAVETIIETYIGLRTDETETFLQALRRAGAQPFKDALYGDAHAAA